MLNCSHSQCILFYICLLLLLSHWVVFDSLGPHGLQQARLPYPSLFPGACSDSCPLSRWCHPTISFSVAPFSFCLQSFPASGFFPNQSAFHIRCPKYWSLSISSYIEYSGLISFRIDWFDLLAVRGTFKSPLQHHSLKTTFIFTLTIFQIFRIFGKF